ncbi:Uncharacterised protein [Salmonella enterica subsp. enterica serovar Bovismorbificans]|nr:Uncharacterised protein [Salmonella enterica subsp. enterica serovar Bovismorbificans]CQB63120.1 Uncharacterised protein [Salmonella enterica subsp. enterica serovar Bovismorbificans]
MSLGGGKIFSQMAEQQFQRFFITSDLVQLQRQLRCQSRILRILRDLLLKLLNFRRIRRLFKQFDLRNQPLVTGILIL